jgi:hypothetical protein
MFAAASAVVMTTGVLFLASFTGRPQSMGAVLFSILSWPCFALCLIEGIRLTADCLSEERREGTLRLLLLTDLRPLDVVLGKLAGVALNSVYLLLAVLPCFGVPFLLGGITAGEFWRLLGALAITLALSLASGLAVSSCVTDSLRAWAWTASLVFLLTAGPLALEQVLGACGLGVPVSAASPWQLMHSLRASVYDTAPGTFWASALCCLGETVGFVGLACRMISRPAESAVLSGPARVRRLHRRAPRALLDGNPAYWLSARQGWWSRPACATAWGLIALALAGVVVAPDRWDWILGTGVVLLGGAHYALIFWQGLVSVRVGSELRSEGAAELLLVTPLSPHGIALGLGRGLIRQSLPPGLSLLAGEFLLGGVGCFIAGLHGYAVLGTALVVWIVALGFVVGTLLDLWGVVWMGLYQGLSQRKRATATAWTVCWIQIVPLLIFGACGYAAPTLWVLKSLVVMLWARDRLVFGFLRIVRQSYDNPDRIRVVPPPLPSPHTPLPRVIP